ncbi:MAG: S9 family peptidase [candidate division Zixibacteria bacterium]
MRKVYIMIFVLAILGIFLVLNACESEKISREIPLEVLFSVSEIANPLLSPNGDKVAYLGLIGNLYNIFIFDIATSEKTQITHDAQQGIKSHIWSGDGSRVLYLRDVESKGYNKLFDYDLATGEVRELTPMDGINVQILKVSQDCPNSVIISFGSINDYAPHVYKVDLVSGNFELIAENSGTVLGWLIDHDLNARGSLEAGQDGQYNFMVTDTVAGKWRKIITWNPEDMLTSSPVGFSADGQYAFILNSQEGNTSRLQQINIASGKVETIAEDNIFNVFGAIFHPRTGKVQGVIFEKEREETIILDDAIRDDIEAIKNLHHGDFFISSRDKNDENWLIGFKTDNGPVPFYLYKRSNKKAIHFFNNNTNMENYEFASMESISFSARDGSTIYGYITFPVGLEKKNLPLVVCVHEGPWNRDRWVYDSETQWLANRGYICLQINYRGSTGFGKKFYNAGNKQWGMAMVDDLVDGVLWAVEKGYADPNRVAIWGWRYGGHAALMAAIRYPDVFSCVVDVCGYLNLETLIKAIPASYSSQILMFRNRVGDPTFELDILQKASPINYADSIITPLLIVQGGRDRLVLPREADSVIESLVRRGIDNEYLLFDNEGHGLSMSSNRLLFYQTSEEFLRKHLGSRKQN